MTSTLTILDDDTEWMADAACRGAPPDVFFPTRGESAEPALAICARCGVFNECLDYAVRHRIREGVWALPERDRRRLYRAVSPASQAGRPEPAHGTDHRYRRGCHCPDCREAHAAAGRRWRDEQAQLPPGRAVTDVPTRGLL